MNFDSPSLPVSRIPVWRALITPVLVAALFLAGTGPGSLAQENLRIEDEEGGGHSLQWDSQDGTTSFIQRSTDLVNWQFTPHYHVGDGTARAQALGEDLSPAGNNRNFLRLVLHPTNPADPDDTDGDGLSNDFELGNGYIPTTIDSDGNGTNDGDEDLDGDGESNSAELNNGTDPNNNASNSASNSAEPIVVSQQRGKTYTHGFMIIDNPENGDTLAYYSLINHDGTLGPNEYEGGISDFDSFGMGGWVEYEGWAGAFYEREDPNAPQPSDRSYTDVSLLNMGDVVDYDIERRFLLVTNHIDTGDITTIEQKMLLIPAGATRSNILKLRPKENEGQVLLPVDIAVDANRDGEIKFDGSDKTTEDKPYQFWINDDHDLGNTVDGNDWEEDDLNDGIDDAIEAGLHSRRDLEDLTRIWLDLKSIKEVFGNFDGFKLSVRMNWIDGAPAINLFKTVEADGGREYLKDSNVGWNQYNDGYGTEIERIIGGIHNVSTWIDLPDDELDKALVRDGKVFLLLEGVYKGQSKITFRLKKGDMELKLPPVYIDLKEVTDMYETWTVGDVAAAGVQWENTWPTSSATQTTGNNLPVPQTLEEKDYVLFIHGWNMAGWDKTAFASTMFKRMWHQGYKGRFGAFRWPTFHGLAWNDFHTAHYDGSEQRAWNSGSRLAALVNNRAATFKDNSGKSLVRCYAHSMGNVVTGEALRQLAAGKVHTYIAGQAAIPAHVWDKTTPSMNYGLIQGPTTPNVYGYYWQAGATSRPDEWEAEGRPSYMAAQYMPAQTRYINHYNPDDWALASGKWQLNQKLKPDANYDYGITPLNWTKHFYHQPILNTRELAFPGDRYEIFSYAAESRSYATGAEANTGGKFDVTESVNLKTKFGFEEEHKGHSAQFRSFIQKRWTYWTKAMEDMSITP